MLGTSYSLMQFVFSPVWGRWSDRIGRKPIILLGLAGSCLSYLTLALAASLPVIFLARIVGGIAGANIPTAQAYIADVTTPEKRAKGMGLVGAAFGLGFVFGPAIGGLLARLGPSAPMWAAAALCFGNAVAAWWLLPESRTPNARAATMGRLDAMRRAVAHPALVLLLSLYFIVTVAFSGFEATFALFSERRFGFTAATMGLLFAFIGIVLALVQGVLVGRIVPRVGEARLIPAAIFVVAAGLGLIPLSWSVAALMVAVGTLAAGMGFCGPSLSSMVSRLAGADHQGGILGLASSLSSLGRIVGPAWGGYLFDRFGSAAPYQSSAAIMLVAFAVSLAGLRRLSSS